MKKRRDTEQSSVKEKCKGGKSFSSNHVAHDRGKIPDIVCYRCQTRMGCSYCCELPSELLCLVCNNWADRRGVARHGDIVPNYKVRLVRTDAGYRRWTGANAFDFHKVMRDITEAKTAQEQIDLLVPDPAPTTDKSAEQIHQEAQRREELRAQARRLYGRGDYNGEN